MIVVNKQRRRVDREALAHLARTVMEAEGCRGNAELSVVIGDDRWIQELNRKYRKTNAPTDVLAFPQGKGQVGCADLMGDVALSGETAARQAKALGHKLQEELAVLMVHGILHLTGWQDKTPNQRRSMMRRTQELLGQIREGRDKNVAPTRPGSGGRDKNVAPTDQRARWSVGRTPEGLPVGHTPEGAAR